MVKKDRSGFPSMYGTSGIVLAACFGTTLLYGTSKFLSAYREANIAATNGLPSVERLTEARANLRQLDAAMDAALLVGQPFDRSTFVEPRRALQGSLDAYQALPTYPGELEQLQLVSDSLRHLDEAKTTMFSILETGDLGKAHEFENSRWRFFSDQLDSAIHSLIVFNSRHLDEHVGNLERMTIRTFIALLVGGLASIVLTIRAARTAARAMRERESLLEARAREWEAFSGRVAHDLVSPLQTVSFAMNIAHERANDEQVAKLSAKGMAALKRVRATVDALLNFARAGAAPTPDEHAAVADAVSVLLDELRPAAEEQLIELTTEPIPACEVACSASVLHVVLSNLVQNAIKHMGDRTVRRIVVKVSVAAKRARIEVHDTGPGLAPAMEHEVSKPYVRGAVSGVAGIGLGLSTVKRIVDSYGGEVGVRSVKGEGSVFWVELPRLTATAAAAT
jgi:signal transduction histidine kinase